MSFALPARQVTFGRSNVSVQQQQLYQQQQIQAQLQQQQKQQQQQAQQNGLALPGGAVYKPSNGLALPGPSPLSNSFQPSSQAAHPQTSPVLSQSQTPPSTVGSPTNAVAGPSTPAAVPATPVPLTLEQQHITAVEGIVPTLQNIVATVNLDCRLDLKTIALHARNAEYNPKRFAAVIMRIRDPKTTALIFASGKMVVTGAKSEDDSRLASRKYARIVQKLGFDAKFAEFKIQNIVGSCDVKFPIRLEGLAYSHGQFSSYEPELFPGLIYRMIKPKVVLLIFVSGKIVLTGAKVISSSFLRCSLLSLAHALGVACFHVVFCKSGSGGTFSGGGGGGTNSTSTGSPSSSRSGSVGSSTKTASSPGHSSTGVAVSSPWKLVEEHTGNDFFDGWTFTNAADVTTHGIVDYVDQNTANANNLTQITSGGTAIMRVETTQTVSGNRQSIRITTNGAYDAGLWILDALHIPTGCGTWPAFWTNGPNWPDGGEIDIVEGVGDNTNNQATLHTLPGCSLSSSNTFTGTSVTSTDCVSTGGGCGIRAGSTVSYGAAFNNNGGGVFTMTLNSSNIALWFFERSEIPSDISSGTPLPNTWGTPYAQWSSSTCNIAELFGFQSTIFDTTLCGDLAGSVWGAAGAPGQEQSCAARTGVSDCDTFVRNNGASFLEASFPSLSHTLSVDWEIISVRIYQIPS
ncbi:hypothetical protein D9757_007202 [Collybiopsis confluens]|uniref:GH16 domain-containing protein n=1 Tax=Collybiopsis confluens TaxID=2823264 RepID=A0A8H5HBD5_9AGAR|nr:hypothetical protein D9757_007202 [Collybiopsis confluens]